MAQLENKANTKPTSTVNKIAFFISLFLSINVQSAESILALAARLFSGKNSRRLFLHVQIILYGFDPFDASGDFPRFIDSLLGINEAAQLNGAFVRFDTDLE